MKLTDHFSLSEFEYSSTALANGIDNHCPSTLIPNLKNLCNQVLEPLRTYVREPVIISSGYRCPELNQLLGGVPNSQHLTGEAADICLSDTCKLRKWYNWLKKHTLHDQLIMERKGTNHWIHVSCRLKPTQNRYQSFHLTVK